MRLNRYLAACGVASRRAAEEYILEGRVRVNGNVCTELATFVEPGKDRVEVDGRRLDAPVRYTYYLLHKPVSVVTTSSDPEGRATVLEFVPRKPRVFTVGRLDYDTSGALLMTDDGTLAHRLLHPRYRVEKEYEVLVQGAPGEEAIQALRDGVVLDDGRRTAPAHVEVVERRPNRMKLVMIIHEGRNRQIRRMIEAVGHTVLELARLRVGPLALGEMEAGTYRELTEDEVAALRRQVREGSPRPRPRGLGPARRPEGRRGPARPGSPARPGGPARSGGPARAPRESAPGRPAAAAKSPAGSRPSRGSAPAHAGSSSRPGGPRRSGEGSASPGGARRSGGGSANSGTRRRSGDGPSRSGGSTRRGGSRPPRKPRSS